MMHAKTHLIAQLRLERPRPNPYRYAGTSTCQTVGGLSASCAYLGAFPNRCYKAKRPYKKDRPGT
jgi:hypothetical protein